jgi:ADP-ribose pyrophosphatase
VKKVEKTLESKSIYKGRVISLRLDSVQLDSGKKAYREIVEHPGAVGIIPLKGNGDIILVKQYRKAVEEYLLELPAGKLEAGEDPGECAARELKEETGYRARNIRYVSSFYTSPGFSNEVMHVFIATGLEYEEKKPDEDEVIKIIEINHEEALDMALNGKLRDAKTITGILLLNMIKNDMT